VTQAKDEIKIGGLGASRKRVEDNRFIRGRGRYVDDIVLPGMLHMEILRSPLAHANITSIDVSKAWEIPGVRLVLTGEMMAARNLAWMPTLSYDTQAVLATDKVRFQGQEVACVVADDPYIAKDACEAIVVEYEPLPVIVNPAQALALERAHAPRACRDRVHQEVARPVLECDAGKGERLPPVRRALVEPDRVPHHRRRARRRALELDHLAVAGVVEPSQRGGGDGERGEHQGLTLQAAPLQPSSCRSLRASRASTRA